MSANLHPYELPLSRSTATMRSSRASDSLPMDEKAANIIPVEQDFFTQDTFPDANELCHIRLFVLERPPGAGFFSGFFHVNA
jgi:hypothetical protein